MRGRRPKGPDGPEDRRLALVVAAYRLVAEQGFEGLRTRDVAAAVGVNVATLHYYFPTKEKLIQGVVEYAMGRFRSTLQSEGSSAHQLRSYLRATRKLLEDEPQLGSVMGELALRSSRDPALARIMWDMNEAWHRTVRGLLRRGAKQGHLRPELDSDQVAALIVATQASLTLPRAAVRNAQALRQLERWLGLAEAPA